MLQLQHRRPLLASVGLRVVVVSFQDAAAARRYAEALPCHWPVLVDEARALYRAYGMGRASAGDLWGPATWWAYLKEALRGKLPRPPQGDPTQQGGDVLVDPAGIVRLHHVGRGPADRPRVDDILALCTGRASDGR